MSIRDGPQALGKRPACPPMVKNLHIPPVGVMKMILA